MARAISAKTAHTKATAKRPLLRRARKSSREKNTSTASALRSLSWAQVKPGVTGDLYGNNLNEQRGILY